MNCSNIVEAQQRFDDKKELDWIADAKGGDKAAFQQLYLLHYKRVFALCLRMTADSSQAEDACQEVFVQVWQKLDNFRGDSRFSTWLHSVASHVVISQMRKQASWWKRLIPQQEGTPEPGTQMSELSDLDKLILQLPERARVVFVLFAVEGYRHEEIAQMLNMAVGTSKAQYHRARTLLKEWLDD